MQKLILSLVFLIYLALDAAAQVKIHSHNDYTREHPFYDAINMRVNSMEADVFLINDTLFVAHTKREIKPSFTLEKLYLDPIKQLSKSNDFYSFNLLIDVKKSWETTAPDLLKILDQYHNFFKTKNAKLNIVFTGNIPAVSTFHTYPDYIKFDGLPESNYSKADLDKVEMISTSFKKYSKWNGQGELPETDKQNLLEVIENAHKVNKPVRFWSAPDTKEAWILLHKLGADIINTDKINDCAQYFKSINEF